MFQASVILICCLIVFAYSYLTIDLNNITVHSHIYLNLNINVRVIVILKSSNDTVTLRNILIYFYGSIVEIRLRYANVQCVQ